MREGENGFSFILGGNDIGRTVWLTRVWFWYRQGEEFVKDSVTVYGALSERDAQKKLRRYYEDDSISVTKVEHDKDFYVVDFNDFMRLAFERKEKNND